MVQLMHHSGGGAYATGCAAKCLFSIEGRIKERIQAAARTMLIGTGEQ
jgi:hypothetical protein